MFVYIGIAVFTLAAIFGSPWWGKYFNEWTKGQK